jgi:hypothetical protein
MAYRFPPEHIIPIPIKKCINFLVGIGMRDRRSRRNAKHFGGKADAPQSGGVSRKPRFSAGDPHAGYDSTGVTSHKNNVAGRTRTY